MTHRFSAEPPLLQVHGESRPGERRTAAEALARGTDRHVGTSFDAARAAARQAETEAAAHLADGRHASAAKAYERSCRAWAAAAAVSHDAAGRDEAAHRHDVAWDGFVATTGWHAELMDLPLAAGSAPVWLFSPPRQRVVRGSVGLVLWGERPVVFRGWDAFGVSLLERGLRVALVDATRAGGLDAANPAAVVEALAPRLHAGEEASTAGAAIGMTLPLRSLSGAVDAGHLVAALSDEEGAGMRIAAYRAGDLVSAPSAVFTSDSPDDNRQRALDWIEDRMSVHDLPPGKGSSR